MASPKPPAVFELLSDAVRWQIVNELRTSDRRVGELVAIVGRPQNVVSYHLAELRNAGVATAHRSSADGRDIYYRVDVHRCVELLAEAAGSLHPGTRLTSVTGPGAKITGRPSLLFLCTGNSARSQIAEALAVHRSTGQVRAVSAGSHPKPLHPNAVRVLAERGIDISERSSKPLTRYANRHFDRVITLCDKVREICPEFPGTPVPAHWSIEDPASSGPDDAATYPDFVQVADDIDRRVELLLADLASTNVATTTATRSKARVS
jgi:ArsR family transcriptional regulator, arsenate/arsenite/antimonite-responsive transcriptional repressor / arsenate reductase (thioredoxin)